MSKIKLLFAISFFHLSLSLSAQTPVDKNGKLKLVGLQLSSECGKPVQLKGMSSHGPQWTANCLSSKSAYTTLQNDWGADVFRIAMYVEETGYLEDTAYYTQFVDQMVDEVGAAGMYCIIDWHILSDGNPLTNLKHAIPFWDYMSKKHGGKKHVMYEICNEPNGKNVTWDVIKSYAETIIPIIRKNDSTSIIIVGTPNWSGQPWTIVGNELKGKIAENVMYTFHFYAASHASYLPGIKEAVSKIPIFVTEWGGVQSSGKGLFNETITNNFMSIFNGNNEAGVNISWCNWSFSDVNEGSSVLLPYSCSYQDWNNTSATGKIVKSLVGKPDLDLLCTSQVQLYNQPSDIITRIGKKGSFGTKAIGDSLKYQWQFSTDSVHWSNIAGKDTFFLKIDTIKLSDKGFYRAIITGTKDTLYTRVASLKFIVDGPYLGYPLPVPGRIEAEYYDEGENGSTYSDTDLGNNGGALRDGDVDVEATKDSIGSYNVGWIQTFEALLYTIEVNKDGFYDFSFRVASTPGGGAFSISVGNAELIPNAVVKTTGDWQKWKTFSVLHIPLTKGVQTLIFNVISGGFNLNYIDILPNDPTGLDIEEFKSGLSVFPNPSIDVLNLINSKGSMKGASLEFFDSVGNDIYKYFCEGNDNQINVTRFKSGIYTLKITQNNQSVYQKWIKL